VRAGGWRRRLREAPPLRRSNWNLSKCRFTPYTSRTPVNHAVRITTKNTHWLHVWRLQVEAAAGDSHAPEAVAEPVVCQLLLRTRITIDSQLVVATSSNSPKVQFTGLAQTLGQLEDSNRDFQSNCWASLQILGQPGGCQVSLVGPAALPPAPAVARSPAPSVSQAPATTAPHHAPRPEPPPQSKLARAHEGKNHRVGPESGPTLIL
jgi:hypothetical protein